MATIIFNKSMVVQGASRTVLEAGSMLDKDIVPGMR